MDTDTLNMSQLYRLNDALTAVLAELGWTASDSEDDEKLNDAVLEIARIFFPSRNS